MTGKALEKQIVLASNNRGKLDELNAMFSEYGIKVINQGRFNVDDAQETGLSFIENAILKARHGCLNTSLPCIADDSGLEVGALQGQPGIYSARFSGENATDEDNIDKLLELIEPIPAEKRQARFRCVMVYMRHANDPSPVIGEGLLNGLITDTRCGNQGFGYDPVFYIPELGKTCAQLSPEKKNSISHRAKATSGLITKLIENRLVNPRKPE